MKETVLDYSFRMDSIVHSFRVLNTLSTSHGALSLTITSFPVRQLATIRDIWDENTYPSRVVKYRIRCAVKIKQIAFASTNEYPFVNRGPSTVLNTNNGVQIVVD